MHTEGALLTVDWDKDLPPSSVRRFKGYVTSNAEDVFGSYGLDPARHHLRIHLSSRKGDSEFTRDESGATVTISRNHLYQILVYSDVTMLSDGMLLVPTMYHLATRGAFKRLSRDAHRWTRLEALARELVPQGHQRTLGNIYGGLRYVALHGWMEMEGTQEETRLRVTDQGWHALRLMEDCWPLIERLVRSLDQAEHLHAAFRAEGGTLREEAAEFASLAEQCKRGWDLPEQADPFGKRVASHVRIYMDGVLMTPMLVALRMPLFHKDGNRIAAVAPPIFDIFDKETRALDEARLAAGRYHRGFLDPALSLLEVRGMLERDSRGRLALTDAGERLIELSAGMAMHCSYLRTYRHLGQMFYENADPLGMEEDKHVDRIMNIFGSSAGASSRMCAEIADTVVRRLFDELPLDEQPAGIADMGCGDGQSLRQLAEFVIHHTRRGKHLRERPLLILGADYFEGPRDRTRETLRALEAIEGVRTAVVKANVNRPDEYDRTIQQLGIMMEDPTTGTRRPIGARDLMHTLMFLAHDRALDVTTVEDATQVVRERLESVDRDALQEVLARRLGPDFRLPSEPEALLKLVVDQFVTCYSDKGRLVPGVVAAADLTRFMSRWARFAWHGVMIMEAHDPTPVRMQQSVPSSEHEWMRVECPLLLGVVWGIHYISRQFMGPYGDHELAMLLAGMPPLGGKVTGGMLRPALPAIDRVQQHRSISIACYRNRDTP